MARHMDTRRQATGDAGRGGIGIQFAKKQTFEHPLSFEVCVLVTTPWPPRGMDMLPGMRVPIHLDQDQQLILIAHDQELLADRSGTDRAFPIQVREEALNQIEGMA